MPVPEAKEMGDELETRGMSHQRFLVVSPQSLSDHRRFSPQFFR